MEMRTIGPNLDLDQDGSFPGDSSSSSSADNNSLNNQQIAPTVHDASSGYQRLQRHETATQSYKAKPSGMPEDREKEQSSGTKKRTGPLRLLDLPLDILKEILKEITLTNDLASLAMTHSALHQLVIPQIYSRFDIVWPDKNIDAEPRTGVDALTYGLATLVMNEDILRPTQTNRGVQSRSYCERCTCDDCHLTKSLEKSTLPAMIFPRRGNRFSQYIRKFSLGNGPSEWVQEYLITKEGGKMLGTLIALAVAHMPNLETFIWDMPTGILRDVWISLSSPACRERGLKPKLEKLWVRFHDNGGMNSEPNSPSVTTTTLNSTYISESTGQSASENANPPLSITGQLVEASFRRIEHPNLAILPPLSSLSVLDIDEFANLWEMSILIGKSMKTLRELRIGMASYLSGPGAWASTKMVDSIGPMGVIGTIMAGMFIYFDKAGNVSYQPPTDRSSTKPEVSDASHQAETDPLAPSAIVNYLQESSLRKQNLHPSGLATETTPDGILQAPLTDNLEGAKSSLDLTLQMLVIDTLRPNVLPSAQDTKKQDEARNLQEGIPSRKLHLEVFEVESVSLNVSMLLKVIDWSVLSSLTVLCCECHEQLWKALRRNYAPRPASSGGWQKLSSHATILPSSSKSKASSASSDPAPAYQLKLKKIHTDAVSPALVAFLKDALAPNSLEWLFLQDGRAYNSPVTLDTISRGPIRHHRASLKKLMIDSAIGKSEVSRNLKRKKCIFNRDLLTFITSGKMCRLKELTMNINHSDWHFFLQRLPRIPHLCSLYIPHVADHVDGAYMNAKELALQLVDVVAIRPEIQLLYIGLSNSCFELVESLERDQSKYESHSTSDLAEPGGTSPLDGDTHDDDVDEHSSDIDQNTNHQNPVEAQPEVSTPNITSGDPAYDFDDPDEDANEGEKTHTVLKLREILFYDDKISIFKARHGRL